MLHNIFFSLLGVLQFHFEIYRIVGMFGGVNVWRIAELKVIGEIKFGEWIDFGHKDTIYLLKFG